MALAAYLLFTPIPCNGAYFSYAEWSANRSSSDLIVLADGSKLSGTLQQLPSLDYSFAPLNFRPDEIATANLYDQESRCYIQIITRTGQHYRGPLSVAPFVLLDQKGALHTLWPNQVDAILLQKPAASSPPSGGDKSFFTLTLKDGAQLPVAIAGTIALSDGWKAHQLRPCDIIDLKFDGKLKLAQGTFPQGAVDFDQIGSLFVTERFFTFQTPKVMGLIKLPWENVAHIGVGSRLGSSEDQLPTPQKISSVAPEPILKPILAQAQAAKPDSTKSESQKSEFQKSESQKSESIGKRGEELTEARGALLKSTASEPVRETPVALTPSAEESAVNAHYLRSIALSSLYQDLFAQPQQSTPAEKEKEEIFEEEPEAFEEAELAREEVQRQVQEELDVLSEEDEADLARLVPDGMDEEMELLLELSEREEADLLWSDAEEDPELERALIDSLF